MSIEFLSAFAVFALVGSITPGPNNLMLMASGANFGFWRTLPHLAGIAVGFALVLISVGLGLMQVFDAVPASLEILRAGSIVYLLYLAWRIATSTGAAAPDTGARPITPLQAALFQWINPKAWALALTAITAYAPTRSAAAVALVALLFCLIHVPSNLLWVVLGQKLAAYLRRGRRLRRFNIAMATMLVATLYPVLHA